MLLGSLKTSAELFIVPVVWLPQKGFQFVNYARAWTAMQVPVHFLNSSFVAIVRVAFELFFASLAGFGFAKYHFPAKHFIFTFLLCTIMIPFQIIMIPLFIIIRELGLIDSLYGVTLPALVSAFGVFVMRQFIITIPDEYLDAARIDGSGELGILFRVILPSCRPAIATLGILTFLSSWNDLLWPLIVLTKEELYTLPLMLARFQSDYHVVYNQLMSAATVICIPILCTYLFFQRYFVQGVALSGLKG